MILQSTPNGELYLARRSKYKVGGGKGIKKHWNYYNWFPTRVNNYSDVHVTTGQCISLPQEYLGKRLRFKVEIEVIE